jgi:biopolymer transport protein ExbD
MRPRRLKNEINVVPYIDVMLVLLVIFMVTAPMMTTARSTCRRSARPRSHQAKRCR